MNILELVESPRVLVQGITGTHGSFHTEAMLTAGTDIVGGVTPGKGGQIVHGVPVFDSVAEAMAAVGHQATWRPISAMSGLPLKAEIAPDSSWI